MLTSYHIRLIIEKCREMGSDGLDNGINAAIPQLYIDILTPPHDFLGVKGNPAIFINKNTFKLLGHLHKDWNENQTIALKTDFLKQNKIDVVGTIIHEMGHAFNVAANIANTEENAYIFEIEVICKLFEAKSPLLFGCTQADIQSFFKRRLSYYTNGTQDNAYLTSLVETIKHQFNLEEEVKSSIKQKQSDHVSFFVTGLTLFKQKQWGKEYTLTLSKLTLEL